MRDIENGTIELARRDTLQKEVLPMEGIDEKIEALLDEIQESIYNKALNFRDNSIHYIDTWEEFKDTLENKGGFIMAHWDGTAETEQKIQEETKATIRCIPLGSKLEEGTCIFSGKPSKQRVLFAKAY